MSGKCCTMDRAYFPNVVAIKVTPSRILVSSKTGVLGGKGSDHHLRWKVDILPNCNDRYRGQELIWSTSCQRYNDP